jgi:hypothetical protein
MARGFVHHLNRVEGDVNLRDFQHASRLYLDNNYAYTPKAGWIYYVELKINSTLTSVIDDPLTRQQFQQWYARYNGQVGLLAKTVDMPKITIDTEVVNQYNKKTVIQKGINYGSVGITFHDDMSNMTTNLWKSYYQYYYGDSIDFVSKYRVGKYDSHTEGRNFRYGLNNAQTVPFFRSFVFYQLHQRKFTSFEIINPLIKSWDHDSLDQGDGVKMLTNKMVVDYETLIYDTGDDNYITRENVGFNTDHYDNTPSPLQVKKQQSPRYNLPLGRDDVFGRTGNPRFSPLNNLINAGPTSNRPTQTNNARPVPSEFKSSTSSKTASGVIITDTVTRHSPVGISVPNGRDSNKSVTQSTPVNLSNNRNPGP